MTEVWRIISGKPAGAAAAEPWVAALEDTVTQWNIGRPFSSTSGTTGQPVEHRYSPEAVLASARATAVHFGLEETTTTWSALPASGTGGRMAVWRALALGWDLTVSRPSAAPQVPKASDSTGRFDFSVATPMQARHLLDRGQLDRFHQLLLGGAPLDPVLEMQLLEGGERHGCRIHLGFGMTETLTHIATRPLGTDVFRPLQGVSFKVEEDGALTIDAPDRGVQGLRTRDAVETADGGFRWLGRLDDVLNSGGIKVHPHALEQALAPRLRGLLGDRRWYVSGRPDAALGDRITLVVEGTGEAKLADALLEAAADEGAIRPRSVEFATAFEETATGKLRRN